MEENWDLRLSNRVLRSRPGLLEAWRARLKKREKASAVKNAEITSVTHWCCAFSLT